MKSNGLTAKPYSVYHPDRNPGDNEAAGKFKQVLDAYEVLSDTLRRANYDQVTRPLKPRAKAKRSPSKKNRHNSAPIPATAFISPKISRTK